MKYDTMNTLKRLLVLSKSQKTIITGNDNATVLIAGEKGIIIILVNELVRAMAIK